MGRIALTLLIGWYLLTPNLIEKPDGDWAIVDTPITQWDHRGSYDTAALCEDGRSKLMRLAAELWKDAQNAELKKRMSRGMSATLYGACIASDDPRLRPRQ